MFAKKKRHMFAGGNTVQGFFSYYDNIINKEEAKKVYILKGGPGTGKSTFMKDIEIKSGNKGYSTEIFHCSSDSDSVDGLAIPELSIALIDGTLPHIIDPKYPGIVDKTINLDNFLNGERLKRNKDTIVAKKKEIKRSFERAYRYLRSVVPIYDELEAIFDNALNSNKVYKIEEELIDRLFKNNQSTESKEKQGSQRHLFAGAITPKGVINYLYSILDTKKVYRIEAQNPCIYKNIDKNIDNNLDDSINKNIERNLGLGDKVVTKRLIRKIIDMATAKGYSIECFYCSLFPDVPEHIIIHELDISITTANKYHNAPFSYDRIYEKYYDFPNTIWETIDLTKCYNNSVLTKELGAYRESERQVETLLNTAINSISKAKELHHEIEGFYRESMDFSSLNQLKDIITNEILNTY